MSLRDYKRIAGSKGTDCDTALELFYDECGYLNVKKGFITILVNEKQVKGLKKYLFEVKP